MHAGNGATRRATFLRHKLPLALLVRVLQQRNAGITALLRTVMNQAVFANVQVARAGSAAPVVFQPLGDVLLKLIDPRKRSLFQRDNFIEDLLLARAQRFQLPIVVVKNSESRGESELDGPMRDGEGVCGISYPAAQN